MIKENLNEIQNKIKNSLLKRIATTDSSAVKLIAVTKNHEVAAMQEAIDAGVLSIGENRIQEAASKAEILGREVEWHLLGHLQTNKVKQAVHLFDLIHSVDSKKIAVEINKEAKKINKIQDVLLQVNIAKEESKFGIYAEDLPALLRDVDQMDSLHVCGLMTIAPICDNLEEVRPIFKNMFQLYAKMKQCTFEKTDLKWLSMGMSHDYTAAIEEGANMVRIGTAIFGPRQY